MHRVLHEIIVVSAIGSTAAFWGCYESTMPANPSSDTAAADTDTLPDTGGFPDTGTEVSPTDTETDTSLLPQGPLTFRIRNGRSFIAYFDLSFLKWMDLYRGEPQSENEIYLNKPYCVERCIDVPNDPDLLCRRPCIVSSQAYALLPGDEVDVPWDGKVRLLDPDRLPYCFCSIETNPLPGRYTVAPAIYIDIRCPEPCPVPEQSGILQGAAVVAEFGPSLISVYPLDLPIRESVVVLEI